MDDKHQLEIEGGRRVKSSHLGITLLVLALLLGACVASLIYVAVRDNHIQTLPTQQPHAQYRPPTERSPQTYQNRVQSNTKPSVKDEAHINIRKEDGSEVAEDVEYDEGTDVAIFKGSDGSFLAEDFEKGFNVMNDPQTGNCYVFPVGTNKTAANQIKNFVKNYDGHEMQMHTEQTYRAMVLPGAIDDTSFLPPAADEYCNSYQWLSIVNSGDNPSRKKRQTTDSDEDDDNNSGNGVFDEDGCTYVCNATGRLTVLEFGGKRYLVYLVDFCFKHCI